MQEKLQHQALGDIHGLIPLLAGHEDVGHLRGCPASSWPTFLGRGLPSRLASA